MTIYFGNLKISRYTVDGSAHIATHFDSLEKSAKIACRALDITALLVAEMNTSLKLLSTQLKSLVLVIESTRFFPVAYPLFVLNEKGKSFFEVKTKVQIAEKVSLTAHLILKTLGGLDRVKLITLGRLATYSLGYLTVFRWIAESTILMFNFFGAIDGYTAFKVTNEKLKVCGKEILSFDWSKDASNLKERHRIENIQHKLKLENTRSLLKVAATVSKFFVIVIAVTLAATNQVLLIGDLTILGLGIISDSFGLARIFHNEYIS